MAMHTSFTWMESHIRQPDIQRVGWLFSILVAPTLHVIFLAVVLILSSSTSINAIGGPLTNLFQRIGQNGFVAWKSVAIHGSEFIFEKDGSEVYMRVPQSNPLRIRTQRVRLWPLLEFVLSRLSLASDTTVKFESARAKYMYNN